MDIARLKYEVDSSQIRAAVVDLNKMNSTITAVVVQQKKLATTSAATGKTLIYSYKSMAVAMRGAQKNTRSFGSATQGALNHVADFAIQVGSGTDVLQALTAQLSLALRGFGPWGAAASAAIAVAGAMIPVISSLGNASEILSQKLDKSADKVSSYKAALKLASGDTEDLVANFGTSSKAARTLAENMANLKHLRALEAFQESVSSMASNFGRFQDMQSFLGLEQSFLSEFNEQVFGILTLSQEQRKQVEDLSLLFRLLGSAKNPTDQALALGRITAALNAYFKTIGKTTDEQKLVLEQLHKGEQQALLLANATGKVDFGPTVAGAKNFTDEINNAHTAYSRLKDSIEGTRLGNIGLEAQLRALQRGESREYAQMAGKIAESQAEMQKAIDAKKISPEKALAGLMIYGQQLRREHALQNQINAFLKKRNTPPRGGASVRSDPFQDATARADERVKSLQAEAKMLSMTTLEAAKYRAGMEAERLERQLLAEAKRNDGVVSEQERQIAESKAQNSRAATVELAIMREQQQSLNWVTEQFQNTATSAFGSLVAEIDTGNEALNRLIASLAEAAFQAALFGKGPMAGLFEGENGLFGADGFFGSIMSLFGFANGGIMSQNGPLPLSTYSRGGIATRPQLALFGEGRMNEAFVPLPDGKTIPVTMSQPPAQQARINQPVQIVNNIDATGASSIELARVERKLDELTHALPKIMDSHITERRVRR